MNLTDQLIDGHSALLIVDMQYDFLPGGALPVAHGDELIERINKFSATFHHHKGKIIFTQDWHPKGHHSFASVHPGKNPGDPISTPGLGPILWPDHCVQNTPGAQLHAELRTDVGIATIRKGYHMEIDSYSAFLENDQITKTGLGGYLHELGITKVFICGLALDYCCFYSAMDAHKAGFDVFFLQDLTRGIDLPENNIANALSSMKDCGIHIITE